MDKNIELELRAEIPVADFDSVMKLTEEKGRLLSKMKRLSVMFLGKTDTTELDIRVRISNNAKAELVIKKGDFHTHDRIEYSQSLTKDQVMGMVKILSLLGFGSKVTERESFNYDLGSDVTLSVVRAGQIAYVEIEKMSDAQEAEGTRAALLSILQTMNLSPIATKEQFDELCARLSDLSDWKFSGYPSDFEKLEKLLQEY